MNDMTPAERFAIILGKCVSLFSTTFGIGAGATWSGEVALTLSPDILKPLAKQFRRGVILVAGTNGKTTTSLMIKTILHYENFKVIANDSGANLLNGVISACIKKASIAGTISADWGVFEVDENSLPIILQYVTPKFVVLLNLFRDQLDRYGEVDVIAEKWNKALKSLKDDTTSICNADDPLVASIGKKSGCDSVYFGLTKKTTQDGGIEHATDSIFCLNCGSRLSYNNYYFSHLGDWYCRTCGEKRPVLTISSWESPLPGLYNQYNTMAAALTAKQLGIHNQHIREALKNFKPAFGRQEEKTVNGKTVKLFLSKNPTGFNASLRAVLDMKPKVILLSLNDRIPDGRDVSWIWDVDFEIIPESIEIVVTGDRVYDLALRLQYTKKIRDDKYLFAEPDPKKALQLALSKLNERETLYVLPTYSAMLEIRKIITGKKIL
jgi:lipid II isoglutaminyl synthase (glutamine-hydrolysing)